MDKIKHKRYQKSSSKRNIGFYISLGLCLTAVAGAAWTTYGSINDLNNAAGDEVSITEQKAQVNKEVSGQSYEKPESSLTESSAPDEKKEESAEEKSSVPEKAVPAVSEAEKNEQKNEQESTYATAEPVENGKVIKGFSPRNPIRSETMNDWRLHAGTDISCKEGAPVHAVMGGKVTKLYKDAMLGNVIIVEHTDGYQSRYCGLTDTPVVKEGDNVSAGSTLGYVGQIPSEAKDGAHLHIEVLLNGKNIDPDLIF